MDTKELYNQQSNAWVRTEAKSLSDFTGRPVVFSTIGQLDGESVLDMGCGEGYATRAIKNLGSGETIGVDLSEEMIRHAKTREEKEKLGITYDVGDIRNLNFCSGSFDLISAVFVFNYIPISDMNLCISEVYRLLKPGGRFVFSVPHPSFAFVWKKKKPFYFELKNSGYFSGRDQRAEGEIFRTDGMALKVQMFHKTFEDYFEGMREGGFNTMPSVIEARVLDKHIELNSDFFSPIADIPLHVVFNVQK